MAPSSSRLSPSGRWLLGLLCVAGGIVPILAAFDLGPLSTRDIRGPAWLGAVAGGIFVLAGVGLWLGEERRNTPLSYLLFGLVLAGFAAIGNWIAFGAGPRQCSGGFGGFFLGNLAEIECRIGFGIGALIIDGALVWVAAAGLRRLAGPGPVVDRLEKIGQAALLLGLSPVLLPLLLFLVGKALCGATATRLRTGKWPRNEEFIARRAARREK